MPVPTLEDAHRQAIREVIKSQLMSARYIAFLALKQLVYAAASYVDLLAVPNTKTPPGKSQQTDPKTVN